MRDNLAVFLGKKLLWNLDRLRLLLEVLLIMLLDNLRMLIFFWTPFELEISESQLFSFRVSSIPRLGLKRRKDTNMKIREVIRSNRINFFADYLRETDSDSILVGLSSVSNG